MRVLVTGATGYIGSHVCKALKDRGHYITGWDRNLYGEFNDIRSWCDEFYNFDITNRVSGEFDAVVHLAGRSVVPQSLLEPTEYYRVNTMGTANIVERVKTPHVIFASTSSAWAMESPYARSKVAAEDVIKEKADGYTIFRFFNVSGSDGTNRQLGDATHLIRVAAMVAANKLAQLEIYGTDYPTRDGTAIRDYVHVVDLANAIANAVDLGPANTPYECIGSNRGYTVLEVIDAMRSVSGHSIPTVSAPRRLGDAEICVVDKLSDRVTLTKTLEDMCADQYRLELGKNTA